MFFKGVINYYVLDKCSRNILRVSTADGKSSFRGGKCTLQLILRKLFRNYFWWAQAPYLSQRCKQGSFSVMNANLYVKYATV